MTCDASRNTCFFYWRWSHFVKMQEKTNHCVVYNEAEYMATSHCTKETVWLGQLLADVEYV